MYASSSVFHVISLSCTCLHEMSGYSLTDETMDLPMMVIDFYPSDV